MSLSVLIKYCDGRPDYFNGFCPQSELYKFWWPVAESLRLPTLQRLEVLNITEHAEAEELVRELKIVAAALREGTLPREAQVYGQCVLGVLDRLMPVFESSLTEWHNVEYISL